LAHSHSIGKWEAACKDFRMCAEIDPEDETIRMKLAIAEAKLAMNK
jgi:hypothetical protein